MKQLVCEMCGSTDLIKQDGVFVCQTCGCKYSIEEARKMMVEGTVEVAGTVKVDNSGLISSYLQMAENALEAGNNEEAELYANKIIEIDPRSSQAWFIKGNSSGWQTTGRNNRYPESIVNWINAYTFAADDKKLELAEKIKDESMKIGAAILQMECNGFARYRSEENAKDVKSCLKMLKDQSEALNSKTGIDIYSDDNFKLALARLVNGCAVDASNATDKDFGTERRHQDQYHWNQYVQEQDRCLELFDSAYGMSNNDGLLFTICKNYITIARAVKDSCSYKYVPSAYGDGTYVTEYVLTDKAKESRTKTIEKWTKRRDYHDPEMRKKSCKEVINNCEKEIAPLEESFAFQKYWEEHAKEKDEIETEIASLAASVDGLIAEKANNALYDSKKTSEQRIDALNGELRSLGLFKGKEKKVIQEKIESEKSNLKDIQSAISEHEQSFDTRIESLQEKINTLNEELSAPRGRLPITHGTPINLFISGKDELVMTPRDMLAFLVDKTPKPFGLKTGTEEDIINFSKTEYELANFMLGVAAALNNSKFERIEWKDDPNKNKTWLFRFFLNDQQTDTGLYCDAKSISSPIEKELRFKLDDGFTPKDASEFVRIVSMLLFDVLPSVKLNDLQAFLAQRIYDIDGDPTMASDGLIIKAKRDHSVTFTVKLDE